MKTPQKTSKALTKTAIESAKPGAKPYKLSDLNSLYLLVSTAGSKAWKYAYRIDGKQCVYSIGQYPAMGIDEARTRRTAAADLVKQGIHPAEHDEAKLATIKKEKANTFGTIAASWIEETKGGWSDHYATQATTYMTRYVIDAPIGKTPIREVTASDIKTMLKGIAVRKSVKPKEKRTLSDERKTTAPSIAKLVCMWCSKVFSYAIQEGLIDINIVKAGELTKVVKKPKTKNNRALNNDELKDLLEALARYSQKKPGNKNTGSRETVIAIELLLLTFVRTVELRKAQWPEFNFMKATWSIPAERMKKGVAHVVPLSKQVIALLQELHAINPPPQTGPQWLFPNRRRGSVDCMSATTINRALQNMGFAGADTIGFTAHGTRGTASTYLHSTKHNSDVVEASLAHAQPGIKGMYNHGDYLQDRREMMQDYAEYLDSLRTDASEVAVA